MSHLPRLRRHVLSGVSAAALIGLASAAAADTLFTRPAAFVGEVQTAGAEPGLPVYAGETVIFSGRGFVPGQSVTLMRGTTALTEAPLTADDKGEFTFDYALDAEAEAGLQPIVVVTTGPDSAGVVEMKVSPKLPLSGENLFEVKSAPVTRGLYQVAYGAAADALFVTAAVGRPPVSDSSLVKIDPETLEIVAQVSPAPAPDRADGQPGGVFSVYGIAADDENGTVWTTNTRQDTVAVYRQDDLSLVKQFEPGAVAHARDVVVDEGRDRAFAGAGARNTIEVFDTATMEKVDSIVIPSQVRGEDFGVMSLSYDEEAGQLFTVSLSTPEAAVIDVDSGEVRIIPLPGAVRASGIAHDAESGRFFVVSQLSDDLMILDADGALLHDVPVGAGPLNVVFDPASGLAVVANRGSGTITAVNAEGEIVANIEGGTYPNHLALTDEGIYAVNKSRGENDPNGDRIWHLLPASN